VLAIGVLRGMRRGPMPRRTSRRVQVLRADQAIIEVAAGSRAKRNSRPAPLQWEVEAGTGAGMASAHRA